MGLYFIRRKDKPTRVKIGVARDPWSRLKQLQTGNDSELEVSLHIDTDDDKSVDYMIESFLHSYFAGLNIRAEWFDIPLVLQQMVIETGSIQEFVVMLAQDYYNYKNDKFINRLEKMYECCFEHNKPSRAMIERAKEIHEKYKIHLTFIP